MNKIVYKIIRSARKTVALEVTRNLDILVRAPLKFPATEIEKFVVEHNQWLEKALIKQEQRKKINPKQLTIDEINQLKKKAKEIIPTKVDYYSRLMNVIPTGVKITSAEKRFGSCSGKNSLCFSYKLMQYPDDAINYVVVHELAHIRHKNHSKNFYFEIERYLPDYKKSKLLLKY